MKDIGGYFELELGSQNNKSFHSSFYSLNSFKSALMFLLKEKNFKQLYIPYYMCISVINCLKKNNINIIFYKINSDLEIFDNSIGKEAVILYVNYFGIKDKYVEKISKIYTNLIIDNAQAFYSKPIIGVDTIYSPRKFFGVPDGGFLHSTHDLNLEKYPLSYSYDYCSHLLKRVELNAEKGYNDFKMNNERIKKSSVMRMSILTKKILTNIDYGIVKVRRRQNFQLLHKSLKNVNKLKFEFEDDTVPMIYPLLLSNNGNKIKKKLILEGIYVATYWPIKNELPENIIEIKLINNLIPLPIDQRYESNDMKKILKALSL